MGVEFALCRGVEKINHVLYSEMVFILDREFCDILCSCFC